MRLSDEGYRRAMVEILRLVYKNTLTSTELAQLDWLSDMAYAYECAMWPIEGVE